MSRAPMGHATKLLRAERDKIWTTMEGWERMIVDGLAEIENSQRQLTSCRQEIEQIDVALKALAAR